jgi:hypothetical protein
VVGLGSSLAAALGGAGALLVGVRDVLQEDQPECDMLIFGGGVRVIVEQLRRIPQLVLEAEAAGS